VTQDRPFRFPALDGYGSTGDAIEPVEPLASFLGQGLQCPGNLGQRTDFFCRIAIVTDGTVFQRDGGSQNGVEGHPTGILQA